MGINIAERDFVRLWSFYFVVSALVWLGNDLGSFSRQQAVCQFAATLPGCVQSKHCRFFGLGAMDEAEFLIPHSVDELLEFADKQYSVQDVSEPVQIREQYTGKKMHFLHSDFSIFLLFVFILAVFQVYDLRWAEI